MTISEAAQLVGRSPDTLRRWEEQRLITPDRDARGRRVYGDQHIARCLQLAQYTETAQMSNRRLSDVVPYQLPLFGEESK